MSNKHTVLTIVLQEDCRKIGKKEIQIKIWNSIKSVIEKSVFIVEERK